MDEDTKPGRKAPDAAPSADKKPEPPIHEIVGAHLKDSKESALPPLSEHIASSKLEKWQIAALLARFHAQGIHVNARMSKDVFDKAIDAALFGRI
jgi:hypothetical protein